MVQTQDPAVLAAGDEEAPVDYKLSPEDHNFRQKRIAADRQSRLSPVASATATALPSVVNISTERLISQRFRRGGVDPFHDFFNQFFGHSERQYKTSSLGSGVIIDPAGLILTNDHVVQRASRIIITMADGTSYDAKPVATDEANDISLLQIIDLPADRHLPAITMARPDDLLLGETVITIGNPFGLGHSVAVGVLSAIGRKATYEGTILFDDILQTDAAINPGNSGGPLINVHGQLIGINLAIQRDAEGIGFAIPVRRLEDVLATWLLPVRFSDAWCGLIPTTRVFEDGVTAVAVKEVRPESPAAKAGLKDGELILLADGKPVEHAVELSVLIWKKHADDQLVLTMADGSTRTITIMAIPQLEGEELARQRLDASLQELTPRLATALKLPYNRGLIIIDVKSGGILDRKGVQKGDVIIQVGQNPITDFGDLNLAYEGYKPGDIIDIVLDRLVERGGRYFLQRFVVEIPFTL